MPVTYEFSEKKDQRSAKGIESGVSYKRVYQLITSERVSEAVAYHFVVDPDPAGEGLDIGTQHPDDPQAQIQSVSIDDDAIDGLQWLVTIEYSVPEDGEVVTNPVARPPDIQWLQPVQSEPIELDFSDTPRPIVASNGLPFDQFPQRDAGYIACSYTKNLSESDFRNVLLPLMGYGLIVNSDEFTIDGVDIPALYARLEIRSADRAIENGVTFYRVVFYLQFREGLRGSVSDGWRERYLNRGYYEIIDSGGKLQKIRDSDGEIVQDPWPLDEDGLRLATVTATPSTAPGASDPGFSLYKEVDFAPLNFV